jgi:predicted ATPase
MLIKSLSLKDFKCFEQVDIDFGKITLLTGANSSGKSSLIYALLGIMQSKYFPQYFALNGELINMGGFDEVLRKKAEKKEFEIGINVLLWGEQQNIETLWVENIDTQQPELIYFKSNYGIIRTNKEKEQIVDYEFVQIDGVDNYFNINDIETSNPEIKIVKERIESSRITKYKIVGKINESISFFIKKNIIISFEFHLDPFDIEETTFNYIGSFRLPPERTYYRKPKAGKVGVNGEGYIDQIIEWEESNKEKYEALIEAITEIGLFHSIQANKMKGGRFELNVKVNEESELASLTDVGFGISQFLPIIVADLQMDYESCLVVSQPEIHLHPKLQATLGDYFCKQINDLDKQYIVETHSEYLINRMRLLIVKGELKPEDVKLYYMENDGIKTTTYAIELTTDGQIKNAPQGFFDTYEMDVMDIALYASA